MLAETRLKDLGRPSIVYMMAFVLRLALPLLGLLGCSAAVDDLLLGRTMLTFRDAQGVVELGDGDCLKCGPRRFAIVEPEQLPRLRKASSLTYLGTQDGFHFLMTWNKVLKPGEVDHVALRLGGCAVTGPRSIVSESAAGFRARRVDLASGGCVVR